MPHPLETQKIRQKEAEIWAWYNNPKCLDQESRKELQYLIWYEMGQIIKNYWRHWESMELAGKPNNKSQ